jgi:hypothetical protein
MCVEWFGESRFLATAMAITIVRTDLSAVARAFSPQTNAHACLFLFLLLLL